MDPAVVEGRPLLVVAALGERESLTVGVQLRQRGCFWSHNQEQEDQAAVQQG